MSDAEIICRTFADNHKFISVDGKKDFIVFNDNLIVVSDEVVDLELMQLIEVPTSDNLSFCASAAWSANCKFFFVAQPDGIMLINVYNSEVAVFYPKPIDDFIRMYL